MSSEGEITVKIEKLAGLGDGVGMARGRKAFIPYTLAGETVRARVVNETSEALFAEPLEILQPSADRIKPVCKHFADCGGCALQHMRAGLYRDFKLQMAREAVRKAGFDIACVEPLVELPAASRRRVLLKVKHGKLGFYAERSHRLVDIHECHVFTPALFDLTQRLKPHLPQEVVEMQINGVDGGWDVLLIATANCKPQLPPLADVKRISLRTGAHTRTLYESGPVTVMLGGVAVAVPPGAFLQAAAEAQEKMTSLVLAAAKGAKRVLDLFAGVGTYSFPLAGQGCEMTAVEGEGGMVSAMQSAAALHQVAGFKAQHRDLFRQPFSGTQLAPFDFIVMNPPRTGAREQSAALAGSKVNSLAYVSCNPATFSRDARLLNEGGYRLQRLAPIDQFVYSAHLEMVAEFTR